ncbi:hypothetical protein SUGI_0340970 [Cryptomeria japonica]|nr:hypothetical protein SUGI_0340970 [Cryptomeria japonica]
MGEENAGERIKIAGCSACLGRRRHISSMSVLRIHTWRSSDEEEDEKGEKKKKKKKGGLKDKIKLHEKKEEDHGHGKTEEQGEKKGLMEKIKEKLPGHNKEEEKEH